MYPVQQPTVITMQPYVVQVDPIPRPRQRARPLIGFGITQLVFSVILFCWSWWMLTVDSSFPIGYVAMFCSLYHVVVSILAIVGGNDAGRFRCCVISCMVLAIKGAIFVCVVTIIPNFTIWMNVRDDCFLCDTSEVDRDFPSFRENHCGSECGDVDAIFIGGGFFVFVIAVIDIVMSSITCCNLCRCCGCCYIDTSMPGYVIQPPRNPHVFNHEMYAPNQEMYVPQAYNTQAYESETAPLPAYEHPAAQEAPKHMYPGYPPAYNQVA